MSERTACGTLTFPLKTGPSLFGKKLIVVSVAGEHSKAAPPYSLEEAAFFSSLL